MSIVQKSNNKKGAIFVFGILVLVGFFLWLSAYIRVHQIIDGTSVNLLAPVKQIDK